LKRAHYLSVDWSLQVRNRRRTEDLRGF
jgi:hypothetical protein